MLESALSRAVGMHYSKLVPDVPWYVPVPMIVLTAYPCSAR
jgi:hypothetical protein